MGLPVHPTSSKHNREAGPYFPILVSRLSYLSLASYWSFLSKLRLHPDNHYFLLLKVARGRGLHQNSLEIDFIVVSDRGE